MKNYSWIQAKWNGFLFLFPTYPKSFTILETLGHAANRQANIQTDKHELLGPGTWRCKYLHMVNILTADNAIKYSHTNINQIIKPLSGEN